MEFLQPWAHVFNPFQCSSFLFLFPTSCTGAFLTNEVIVTNTRAFEDVIARLRRMHVEEVVQCRCDWAAKEYQWRQLRHQRAIDEFHQTIESKQFTNPPKRQKYYTQVRQEQLVRHATREEIIFGMVNALHDDGPYSLTNAIVKETSKKIVVLENQEDDAVDEILTHLDVLLHESEHDSRLVREHLRQLLHEFSAMSLPIPIRDLYTEFKDLLVELKVDLEDLYRYVEIIKVEAMVFV